MVLRAQRVLKRITVASHGWSVVPVEKTADDSADSTSASGVDAYPVRRERHASSNAAVGEGAASVVRRGAGGDDDAALKPGGTGEVKWLDERQVSWGGIAHTYTRTHAHMHTCMHARARAHTHTHRHTHTRAYHVRAETQREERRRRDKLSLTRRTCGRSLPYQAPHICSCRWTQLPGHLRQTLRCASRTVTETF